MSESLPLFINGATIDMFSDSFSLFILMHVYAYCPHSSGRMAIDICPFPSHHFRALRCHAKLHEGGGWGHSHWVKTKTVRQSLSIGFCPGGRGRWHGGQGKLTSTAIEAVGFPVLKFVETVPGYTFTCFGA